VILLLLLHNAILLQRSSAVISQWRDDTTILISRYYGIWRKYVDSKSLQYNTLSRYHIKNRRTQGLTLSPYHILKKPQIWVMRRNKALCDVRPAGRSVNQTIILKAASFSNHYLSV
jgi:hypothetical protein